MSIQNWVRRTQWTLPLGMTWPLGMRSGMPFTTSQVSPLRVKVLAAWS